MWLPLTRKRATKCGHLTWRKSCHEVTPFGDSEIIRPLQRRDGTVEYCTACVAAMAIRCAWCRRFIYPPMPITLYTPKWSSDFPIPAGAVVYDTKPLQVVGCGRIDCADTGADYAGFWVPNENGHGHVRRFRSLLEEAMQTGQGAICDTADGVYEETVGN